jgi:hypothetical protein
VLCKDVKNDVYTSFEGKTMIVGIRKGGAKGVRESRRTVKKRDEWEGRRVGRRDYQNSRHTAD